MKEKKTWQRRNEAQNIVKMKDLITFRAGQGHCHLGH